MNYYCISVLVPTRGRVERLKVLLDSYNATVKDKASAELIFRADDDDPETLQFLRETPADVSFVVGPRLQGYDSMPTFFNELAMVARGDVLMCGNDDMVFKTPGWPRLLLDAANRHPDGLFDLGVSTLNADHFPFATVSRQVVEKLGFMWDPRIFWGDIFLRDVMAYFDRCVMVPEVEIVHDWAGHAPDRVFCEADKDIVRRNPTYWSTVHAPAVHDAIHSLRMLA